MPTVEKVVEAVRKLAAYQERSRNPNATAPKGWS